MRALAFRKAVTVDDAGLLERLIAAVRDRGIRFCVVEGQAVNAYVDPLVSLDLDLAVAADDLAAVAELADQQFRLDRAVIRDVLGLSSPVASLEDVLQGKIWAAQDSSRRPSKRQKDLADIARIIEASPNLRARVPSDLLARLV